MVGFNEGFWGCQQTLVVILWFDILNMIESIFQVVHCNS